MNDLLRRRDFLGGALGLAGGTLLGGTDRPADAAAEPGSIPVDARPVISPAAAPPSSADAVTDATVTELRAMLDSGALSAVALAQSFLDRIDRLDKRGPAINAMIELNPDALAIAARCDVDRKAGRPRGPLHGIPVLIKDNIDSADRMSTSAGSLALTATRPRRDAFIVARLRAAGAVILGKTNLSEWANFRSTRSTSGWSARGGLTRNPHVLDRNTSGSSSGTAAAIAAGFAPLGIGTETDGSIISPSSVCGIVGIKPTVGLWGRSGIVPIAASQDTAGPMARTVSDAATLLGPLAAAIDPDDPAGVVGGRRAELDYTANLSPGGLEGARLGVPRNLAGFHPEVDRVFDRALEAMRSAGAVIVDNLKLGSLPQLEEAELQVLLHEFRIGLGSYLAARAPSSPIKTLDDVIAFNQRESAREMPWFGQELFERAQKQAAFSAARYRAARERCIKLARTDGLDALLRGHRLHALVWPSNPPAWLTDLVSGDHVTGGNTTFAAVAGYPSITVPMGQTHDLPLGLSFVGRAFAEGRLVRLAYAFEQKTMARRPPRFLPTVTL